MTVELFRSRLLEPWLPDWPISTLGQAENLRLLLDRPVCYGSWTGQKPELTEKASRIGTRVCAPKINAEVQKVEVMTNLERQIVQGHLRGTTNL